MYVSSFQSIFTAEGVFHRETAKVCFFFRYSHFYSVSFQCAGCNNFESQNSFEFLFSILHAPCASLNRKRAVSRE